MRNMSFSMTTQQVRNRTKDVTRREGWATLKVGTLLCAVEKGMGLKLGEKVVRLGVIRIVDVRRERLDALIWGSFYGEEEMRREGFPGLDPAEFVGRFRLRGILPEQVITRIVFEYVDGEVGDGNR